MALSDSLKAFYPCNESSGDLIDAHSTHDVPVAVGDPDAAAGFVTASAGSRDFESANVDACEITTSPADLDSGDVDFSIAGWINLESIGAHRVIWGKWRNGLEWKLYYEDGRNRFIFLVYDGSSFGEVLANTLGAPSAGTNYFITGWHDSVNNQIGIAVNGGAADTTAWTTGVQNSAAYFTAGWDGTDLLDGKITLWGYWKKVLTSGERTQLYNSGGGMSYADIIADGGEPEPETSIIITNHYHQVWR